MAHRDKSQGFGFVYVDIKKLLAERDSLEEPTTMAPISTKGVQSVNFNRDVKPAKLTPVANPNEALQDRSQAIQTIRENLDRLQSLHHRLHSMLEELNTISDRKKKN